MNTIGTTQNQDTVNTLLANTTDLVRNLAKPSGSMPAGSTSSFLKLPDEVLSLLVNLIKELSSGLTGTKNTNVATGFGGLSRPEGSILNSPSLPSFSGSVTTNNTSTSFASSVGRTLNVAPLPSLVSPTTGSLSTTELPKAFNPPAIPSLLGNSTTLPTVNASASESAPVTTGLTMGRILNVAPLPSLVSPTTGSLSTAELPKAFNPPAIPSLLGNSTTLPTVNASASESAPVTTGLTMGRILNVAPLPSLVSPTTGSLSTAELPKAFNPPAIPSLLGNSTTLPTVNASSSAIGSNGTSSASTFRIFVPSLTGNATLSALSSADGFSASGARGIVDGSASNGSNGFGNHFK